MAPAQNQKSTGNKKPGTPHPYIPGVQRKCPRILRLDDRGLDVNAGVHISDGVRNVTLCVMIHAPFPRPLQTRPTQ